MSVSTLFLDGDNKQLRDAIFKATPKAVEQCRILAQKFRGKDDMQTCQNIWNFLKNDVTYVIDGEHQKIKLPSALLRERVGDCKSYSLFTAGILGNLGIPFKYALTSYTSDPTPAHIYVKCDNGVIIDAVWTAFNQEKKPNHIYYQKPNMKISYIAGINAPVQKSRQSEIIGCLCDTRQSKSMGCCCDTKGVTGLGGMPCGTKRISGLPVGAYRKPLGTTNNSTFIGIGRTGLDWATAVGIKHDFWDDSRYWLAKTNNFIPRNLLERFINNNGGGIANFLYNAWLRTEPYYLPMQKKYDAELQAGIDAINKKFNKKYDVFPYTAAEKAIIYNDDAVVKARTPFTQLPAVYKASRALLKGARLAEFNAFASAKDNIQIAKNKLVDELNIKYPEKSRVIKPANDNSRKKYRDLEIWWFKYGGSPDDLNDAVKNGNTKSPRGKDANYMLMKAFKNDLGVKDLGLIIRAFASAFAGDKFGLGDDGTFVVGLNGIGCVDFTTCTAVVSANIVPITSTVLSVAEILRAFGIDMTDLSGDKAKAEADKKKKEEEAAAAAAKAASDAAAAEIARLKKEKEEKDAKKSKTNTTLIVGGVGVALVGAYFLLKK